MFYNKRLMAAERASGLIPQDQNLIRHLPYLLEVDDEIVRTRENGLAISFRVDGIDGNTSSDADITILKKSWAGILDGLDDRFTFYIHRLLVDTNTNLRAMGGDGFASDVDRLWTDEIRRKNPKEFMIVVTVVRNVHSQIRIPFLSKKMRRFMVDDTKDRAAELRRMVATVETALGVKAQHLKISDGSLLGYYGALTSGVYRPIFRGATTLLAEDVANVSPRFFSRRIRFDEGFAKTKFAGVLFVKKYSTQTLPGMFDLLDALDGVIVSHTFTPIENLKILERAKLRVSQMIAAEELSQKIQDDLINLVDRIESGEAGCGEHQMTVTIFADSEDELDAMTGRIIGAGQQAGVTFMRESVALEASYFSVHPGNQGYCARSMTVASETFADMASFHCAQAGTEASNLPWGTPVTILSTSMDTAHRFSFHPPGSPEAEPTNGHTLVLGPSQGGKTTTALFLAMQSLRVGGRLIVLDKGYATKMAINALGGQYAGIRIGEPTGLNPLMTENGATGEAWLMDWMSSLLEATGPALTPYQSEELRGAIRQCLSRDGERLRNFTSFQELIGDAGDDRDLAMRVNEWSRDGRYGWVFEKAQKPVVDFTKNRITAIDLTEILDMKTERLAVLSYLIRTLEKLFEQKIPTTLLIDESWQVMDDEYFAKRLSQWLVTARKQKVIVMMMTQFPSQIRASKAKTVLEALPNRLIFPNKNAVPSDYEGYGLNEAELSFVLGGQAGLRREALFKSEKLGSTILDVDLSPLGDLLTVIGGGEAGERKFGADYEAHPYFWRQNHA